MEPNDKEEEYAHGITRLVKYCVIIIWEADCQQIVLR